MRAVAEHNVKENDTCGRIVHGFFHTFDPLGRIDHRVRLAFRISIVSQVDHDIAAKLQHVALHIFRRQINVQCILNQHRSFVCERTAGIVGLNALFLFRFESFQALQHFSFFRTFITFLDRLLPQQTHCNVRRFVQGVSLIKVLVLANRLFT